MGSYSPAWVITEMASNDVWVISGDLWEWLRSFDNYDLSIIANKAVLREQYANLSKHAPFGPTTRFPADLFYFCTSDSGFQTNMAKILAFLGSKDRRGEILSTQGSGSAESNTTFRAGADLTRAADIARQKFIELLSKQDVNARAAMGLYCTVTFEKRFNLGWTEGLGRNRAAALDEHAAFSDLLRLPADNREKYYRDLEAEIADLRSAVSRHETLSRQAQARSAAPAINADTPAPPGTPATNPGAKATPSNP